MGFFELILALTCLGTLERIVHHISSRPKKPPDSVLLEIKKLKGRINQLETIAIGLDPLSKEIEALPERTT